MLAWGWRDFNYKSTVIREAGGTNKLICCNSIKSLLRIWQSSGKYVKREQN